MIETSREIITKINRIIQERIARVVSSNQLCTILKKRQKKANNLLKNQLMYKHNQNQIIPKRIKVKYPIMIIRRRTTKRNKGLMMIIKPLMLSVMETAIIEQ